MHDLSNLECGGDEQTVTKVGRPSLLADSQISKATFLSRAAATRYAAGAGPADGCHPDVRAAGGLASSPGARPATSWRDRFTGLTALACNA